jgi:hypothetical protein
MVVRTPFTLSTGRSFQLLLQLIISLAAIIYVIGFIAANSYYATLGIIDYQLVQARYIATGLIYLFFHFGIATMLAMIIFASRQRKAWIWAMVFFCLWLLLGAAVSLFGGSKTAMLALGMNAAAITFFTYEILTLWSTREAGLRTWLMAMGVPPRTLTAFIGFCLLLLVSISASTWGRFYWPTLSSTLGGGRPNEAVFVFKDLPDGRLPFIPMQARNLTRQLPVLFETSDNYVILVEINPGSPSAVRISRSEVLSVIYAPAGLSGKKQQLPTLTPAPAAAPTATPAPHGSTAPMSPHAQAAVSAH